MTALLATTQSFATPEAPRIEIWHGEEQRVGHLGIAQNDFNVLGHVEPWQEVEELAWKVNGRIGSPMHFHTFRRLAEDGDFNADIPLSSFPPGETRTVSIHAQFRDGTELEKSIKVTRESGSSPLPMEIDWSEVKNPQDVGQYVDGKWEQTDLGLHTAQIGYDRIFLIGNQTWTDYEVQTSVVIHEVSKSPGPMSGGPGLGILCRFVGHVVGGHRNFPAAQPKWGYQPFGAIGWLRWRRDEGYKRPALLQFYPGDNDHATDYGEYAPEIGARQRIRVRCITLPDTTDGEGVTEYSFKIWPADTQEPSDWTWQHVQTSAHALRSGGLVLLAHHVDATFGNVTITPINGN